MLVNRRGRRFCDELRRARAGAARSARKGRLHPDRRSSRACSSRRGRTSSRPRRASRTPTCPTTAAIGAMCTPRRRASTQLAHKLGDERQGRSHATVAEHNARCRSPKRRASERCSTEPPFIALGPVRSVFVHNEGGLAVDAQHRVLGAQGQPIPGLYAAGATGQGGLLLKGHGHHLAWAFVSGRRAGRFAAG